MHSEDQTVWIYESPDGGKTVYRRPMGDDARKELHHVDDEYLKSLQLDLLTEDWKRILQSADSDPVLQEMLDRVRVYWTLKHEN